MSNWGVIFDVDGVLVDSYQAHFLSWQRMLGRHSLDITEQQFAATFGRINPEIFAELYPSIDPRDYEALGDEKEADYRDIIRQNFPEIDGASELIVALHQNGAKIAIGSSGPPENIQAVLDSLPGAEHIMACTNGKEVTFGKPHPEVFLTAAAKINLIPQRCVVIEDAPIGVAAGKAAGCAVVALEGTADRNQLARADLVVNSLRQLQPDTVKKLLQP